MYLDAVFLSSCWLFNGFTGWITNTSEKNLRWSISFFFTGSQSLISCLAKMLHRHWIFLYYHWFLLFSFCLREDKSVYVKKAYRDRENPRKKTKRENERVASGGRLGLMLYWRKGDMTWVGWFRIFFLLNKMKYISGCRFLFVCFVWVILRYFRSKENDVFSSHIHGGVRSLNSWWDLPWMWEERAPFHYTPRLPKNFPFCFVWNLKFEFEGVIKMGNFYLVPDYKVTLLTL